MTRLSDTDTLDDLDAGLSPWSRETFETEAEAKGFAYGLTYGDEPQYEVDYVEPYKEGFEVGVVFRYVEDA